MMQRRDVGVGADRAGADSNGTRADLLTSTSSIAVATLLSRVTGFAKQIVLLAALGTAIASSYTISVQIPNLVSELLIGAVLTAIVGPVLVRAELEDADRGELFVRQLLTISLTLLTLGALLVMLASPILVRSVFLPADSQVSPALTGALTYLVLPSVLFYGLTALLTAVLNTREVFKPGAWAPVLNNLVVLTVFGLYALLPGDLDVEQADLSDPKVLLLGLGTTVGVVVQVGTLLPALRRSGMNLRPAWGIDARLREFAGMGLAVILYVAISQVGLIFSNRIAAGADEAGPAIYSSAWLLLQLPYGVLGVTILTAMMPRLSRNVTSQNQKAALYDLTVATRATLLGLLPTAIYFTAFGPYIVSAIFGYGKFGADAPLLGEAVSWSAFTLIPYALVLVHLRFFYAARDAWTPLWVVLGIAGTKIGLSALVPLLVDPEHVVPALSFVNGVSYSVGALISWMLVRRTLGPVRRLVGVRADSVRIAAWCGAVAAIIYFALRGLINSSAAGVLDSHPVLPLVGSAALYLMGCGVLLYCTNVSGVREVTAQVRAKLDAFVGRRHRSRRSADPRIVGPASDADQDPASIEQPMPPLVTDTPLPHGSVQATRSPRQGPGPALTTGRYRLLRPLAGAHGFDCWEAYDEIRSHRVSLAVVKAARRGTPLRLRALDGADIVDRTVALNALGLQSIAPLLDVVADSGIHFFAFEPINSISPTAIDDHSADVVISRALRALLRDVETAASAGLTLNLADDRYITMADDEALVNAFPVAAEPSSVYNDLQNIGAYASRVVFRSGFGATSDVSESVRTVEELGLMEHLSSPSIAEAPVLNQHYPRVADMILQLLTLDPHQDDRSLLARVRVI